MSRGQFNTEEEEKYDGRSLIFLLFVCRGEDILNSMAEFVFFVLQERNFSYNHTYLTFYLKIIK